MRRLSFFSRSRRGPVHRFQPGSSAWKIAGCLRRPWQPRDHAVGPQPAEQSVREGGGHRQRDRDRDADHPERGLPRLGRISPHRAVRPGDADGRITHDIQLQVHHRPPGQPVGPGSRRAAVHVTVASTDPTAPGAYAAGARAPERAQAGPDDPPVSGRASFRADQVPAAPVAAGKGLADVRPAEFREPVRQEEVRGLAVSSRPPRPGPGSRRPPSRRPRGDVQVRAGPQDLRPEGADEDASRLQAARELRGRAQRRIDGDPDEVRLDRAGFEGEPSVSSTARARIWAFAWSSARRSTWCSSAYSAGGDDARLPHPAAEDLAQAVGLAGSARPARPAPSRPGRPAPWRSRSRPCRSGSPRRRPGSPRRRRRSSAGRRRGASPGRSIGPRRRSPRRPRSGGRGRPPRLCVFSRQTRRVRT